MTTTNPVTADLASKRLASDEKWMDVAIICGLDDESRLGDRFNGALPDFKRVTAELEKSDLMSEALTIALDIINDLRRRCGCPRVSISPDRFHFLNDEEYERVAGPNSPDAIAVLGHVYVRVSDTMINLQDLTHGLAHLLSYWELEIEVEEVDGDFRLVDFRRSRIGLFNGAPNETPTGVGLNEAMTELVASYARQAIAKAFIGRHLDEDQCIWLQKAFGYAPHVNLVWALCERLTSAGRAKSPLKLLMSDYFRGTNSFVEALNGLVPTKDLLAVYETNTSAADFVDRHELIID